MMLEDVEITVDEKLYREFSRLCAEQGTTSESCLARMFAWVVANPAAAMAYIREAAAEQSENAEN